MCEGVGGWGKKQTSINSWLFARTGEKKGGLTPVVQNNGKEKQKRVKKLENGVRTSWAHGENVSVT